MRKLYIFALAVFIISCKKDSVEEVLAPPVNCVPSDVPGQVFDFLYVNNGDPKVLNVNLMEGECGLRIEMVAPVKLNDPNPSSPIVEFQYLVKLLRLIGEIYENILKPHPSYFTVGRPHFEIAYTFEINYLDTTVEYTGRTKRIDGNTLHFLD